MKSFILVGIESSGNHLFCSLFSRMVIDGLPVVGTDMCGWTDGIGKPHEEELFHPVWQRRRSLESVARGRPFVTSRSFPCGRDWPDVIGFYRAAEALGYEPWVAVIVRDQNVVRASCRARRLDTNLQRKWEMLRRQALGPGVRYRYISYESLVQLGEEYLVHWLAEVPGLAARIEPHWFTRIEDANAKHFASYERAPGTRSGRQRAAI